MKFRWLLTDLKQWSAQGRKPVLVLTGARQVGKTTLARAVAGAGFEYVALDDPILRSELGQVRAEAFAGRFPRAILDEIQKAPQLIDTVKAIVDRGGSERYLLLGSSHILLLGGVRETLAGRVQLRRLWPLGLCEAVTEAESIAADPAPPPALAQLLHGALPPKILPQTVGLHPGAGALEAARDRLLRIGGLPGFWLDHLVAAELEEDLETHVALYLERDLADLVRLRDLDPFVRLQRLAAERTGSLLNSSELARDAGMATATANNYLRYLELSFQVVLLQPWFANRSRRLVKSPCLHWTDAGIWRAVTRLWKTVPGQLYESAMVAEVLKVLDAFRLGWQPYHLRTYDGREVDLLLVRNGNALAFEFKSATRVHPQDARHLRHLDQVTGLEHPFSLVVYRGREVVQLDECIWAVPDVLVFGPESG